MLLANSPPERYFSTMSKPLYLIFGNDEYLVSSKAGKIVSALVPEEEKSLKLENVNGAAETVDAAVASLRMCRQALQTIGLLSSEKVVLFHDISFLTENRTGKSETVKEELANFTDFLKKGLPEGQVLVMTAPTVDKRRAFFKTCKKLGNIHEYSVPEDKNMTGRQEMADRFKQMSAKYKLNFSSSLRQMFLDKVGTDTRQLLTEISKLAAFLGDRKDVKREDIEQITSSSREAIAWDLADAFGKKNLKKSLSILHQLLFQKESGVRLVIGLEGRIKDMLIYREAIDAGWMIKKSGGYGGLQYAWGDLPQEVDEVFSEMSRDPRKVHPFRASILAEQALNFTQTKLTKCLQATVEAHEKLVSTGLTESTILEVLLIRMLA